MGMEFLSESHGKRPMGWDGTALICISHETEIYWECENVTELSYLDYTSEFLSQ